MSTNDRESARIISFVAIQFLFVFIRDKKMKLLRPKQYPGHSCPAHQPPVEINPSTRIPSE
jgi:hypothetical protein